MYLIKLTQVHKLHSNHRLISCRETFWSNMRVQIQHFNPGLSYEEMSKRDKQKIKVKVFYID